GGRHGLLPLAKKSSDRLLAVFLTMRTPAPRSGWLLALASGECQHTPLSGRSEPDRPAREERTNMAFRPLHDRVVVRRVASEEKTAGGIIIPDTGKEKPQEGEVVAVGPGARDEAGKLVALDVKAGDRILFGKWSGTEVKIDGEELLIMKESDILGVITGKAGK